MVAQLIAAMLSLAPWSGDRDLKPEARAELYRPVASAITLAARGNVDLAAALAAHGWHETKYASTILAGRCDLMPPGQRCDWSARYKRPMARGVFQLHGWCRAVWSQPDGSMAALEAGARCAAQLLRAGKARCGNWSQAFGTLHRGRCVARPEREATRLRILAHLRSGPMS